MYFKLREEEDFPQILALTKPYFSQRGFTQQPVISPHNSCVARLITVSLTSTNDWNALQISICRCL